MFLKCVSYLIYFASLSNCANILAIVPLPCYSHQIAYSHIWRELSLRGHKVTVITTDPMKDPALHNLTEIDINSSYRSFTEVSKMAETELTMWNVYYLLVEKLVEISEAQLSFHLVQDLIHSNRTFDVVLVEFLFPEFLVFAEIYKCPKILISSLNVFDYFHGVMGNPTHPVLHPALFSNFYGSLNFIERLESTLHSWYTHYIYSYKWIPAQQKLIEKYFNTELSIEKIISDIDMMFLNVNPAIQGSRALGPNTINIGGYRKPIDLTPLPKDVEDFLDHAKEGFIYFSLGGNVKSSELKEETLKTLVKALGEVPYKVLWKFEADNLPGKPVNVKLIKWAPQEMVLSHPNIKLFITQGGLQSIEEAIYRAVPFVIIPFFSDQEQNAKIMKSKGVAVVVARKPTLQKEDLTSAILEVINNPSYRSAVKRIKKLALDTAMTGLEKAVWWTEYVIRNHGAKHLRNLAADIPPYQYYLLDVISFLLVVASLLLLIIIWVLNISYKLFLNRFSKNKWIQHEKFQ